MAGNDPYAVIETGGKQYRVSKGDVIDIELLDNVTEKSAPVTFEKILFLHDGKTTHVGTPIVDGTVQGELVGQVRGEKVISYKYKRRKNYHRKVGHRQNHMRVKITEIGRG